MTYLKCFPYLSLKGKTWKLSGMYGTVKCGLGQGYLAWILVFSSAVVKIYAVKMTGSYSEIHL